MFSLECFCEMSIPKERRDGKSGNVLSEAKSKVELYFSSKLLQSLRKGFRYRTRAHVFSEFYGKHVIVTTQLGKMI